MYKYIYNKMYIQAVCTWLAAQQDGGPHIGQHGLGGGVRPEVWPHARVEPRRDVIRRRNGLSADRCKTKLVTLVVPGEIPVIIPLLLIEQYVFVAKHKTNRYVINKQNGDEQVKFENQKCIY
jgi:hypothetical protein